MAGRKITIDFDEETDDKIEEYRRAQKKIPNYGPAVNKLVKMGLDVYEKKAKKGGKK